ncbi:hypothetical protein GF325_17750 [Candidatus Bathyarchaeota archaeon]|nr:hypothetical protein [Candidatus Bathyarchaeota archaeon]
MTQLYFSRAPVRVCDIGGWTDTWFCNSGAVFNYCVDLYSYIRIQPKTHEKIIRIISENLDLSTTIKEYRAIEYDGTLDLLKAAVKILGIELGMDIFARSDAPPGCGTGTSASIVVSLLGALSSMQHAYHVKHEIAEMAHELETRELDLESGVQDQYAASFGGFNYMEIQYPRVKISQIDVQPHFAWQLEQQMILVYLGSRSSSKIHEAVIKNFNAGDKTILEAFEILKECPREAVHSIHTNNLDQFGEIMNKNWNAQKQLHPEVTNDRIVELERIAMTHDALGFKVNGAGGGGSAVILSRIGEEYKLKSDILAHGFKLLPCKLNFSGLQTWTAPSH